LGGDEEGGVDQGSGPAGDTGRRALARWKGACGGDRTARWARGS